VRFVSWLLAAFAVPFYRRKSLAQNLASPKGVLTVGREKEVASLRRPIACVCALPLTLSLALFAA